MDNGWIFALLGALAVVSSVGAAALPSPSAGFQLPQLRLLGGDIDIPSSFDPAKNEGFYQCCVQKGLPGKPHDYCNYYDPSFAGVNLNSQQVSDWLECFSDNKDNTECCEEAGVGKQSLCACNYSQPFDINRWAKCVTAGDPDQALSIRRCTIDGAYKGQSDEEDPFIPPHTLFKRDLDDIPKKSAGFLACCKSKRVFELAADTEKCCNYTELQSCGPSTVNKLTEQQQSDFLKCFGDDQDDTECCEGAGVGQQSLYACDYSQPFIDFTRWGKSIQTGGPDQALSITVCTLNGAYNGESGQ